MRHPEQIDTTNLRRNEKASWNDSSFKNARAKGQEMRSATGSIKGWLYKDKFYSNHEWVKKVLR